MTEENELECCGFPMVWNEAFGIRRYHCQYRYHHPALWVNQNTGERVWENEMPLQHNPERPVIV